MVQIHITQYPSVARHYPRLLVLDSGQIVADDAPRSIFDDTDFCLRTGLIFQPLNGRRIAVPALIVDSGAHEAPTRHLLVLSHLCFAYPGEQELLRHVNLEWASGEIIGLVGSSGTGKSSLGMLASGLLKPTSGTVKYVDGTGAAPSTGDLTGRVAMLFQQPERQFFLPTCAREVAFGPENLKLAVTPDDVAALLAMVGLDPAPFIDRDPLSLSGGEKRRLAFAAVLSTAVRFLVFDEPTCGLDQEGVGRFLLLARHLRDMGKGLIVISHDGTILRALADRIIWLKGEGHWRLAAADEFFAGDHWRGVVSQPES